jgi:glucose/arabinose dehydrogenase
MRTAVLVGIAAALAAAGFAAAAAWRGAEATPTTNVLVTAYDFRFTFSRKSVPAGRVRFTVVNRGVFLHDFAIGGRKTRLLQHGERAVLTVVFRRPTRLAYRCTLPGHAAAGMKGVLTVGRPRVPAPTTTLTTTAAPATTTTPAQVGLKLTQIGDFARPVLVTAPLGDPRRLFVVEQGGVIRELEDDVLQTTPFLDLSNDVVEVSERGMLSMAFPPDYASSGRFYVYYTDSTGSGNVNVVEYRRSADDPDIGDPATARIVLHVVKPYENHNAGMMQFGPDGKLYIAIGDGDSGVLHPPGAFAQTLDDLLGNILRIEPRPADDQSTPYQIPDTNPFVGKDDDRGEVWDYGLRNPWRFWIDRVTGDLYLGDAGEGDIEEIDYVQGNIGGQNFGWPCFEGTAVATPGKVCPGAVPPIYQYGHAGTRCAVIGGVTVHDARLPSLAGRYLFGDYCDGKIISMLVADGKATEVHDTGLSVPTLSSFGVDGRGRVYLTATDGGVYRLDPAT